MRKALIVAAAALVLALPATRPAHADNTGAAIAGGLFAGAIIGGIIASQSNDYGYRRHYHGYAPQPYYGQPYSYGPPVYRGYRRPGW